MRKIISKIAGLMLGLSLTAGVGVAVVSKKAEKANATEQVYHHMEFNSTNNSKGVSSYSNSWTNTTDGFTWNLANWNNNNNAWSYIKAGNKNTAYVATIATAAAVDKAVTKVDVVISAVTTANINSIKLFYGSSANPTTNETSITVGTGTKTVTIPAASQAANMHYRLAVDCKAASNGSLTLTDLKLYADISTTSYTVSFNGNGGTGSMSAVSDVSGDYTLPANGFTAPSGKVFAGWKAGNSGDLIPAGGSYSLSSDVTFFAQWANACTVTYTAGSNGSGSYAHTSQPEGEYKLLPFTDLSGVSASSGYRFKDYTVGGVSKNPGDTVSISAATAVTVNFEVKPLEGTYDFTNNWSTYASAWGGYAAKTVSGSDLGADYEASIAFTNVSKQSGTITDRPVVAAKSGTTSTMTFVLDSTISATYKITSVEVSFVQWSSSKKVAAALYKGTSVSGTALDSFVETATPRTISTSNLNGDSFIVDFSTSQGSNQQLGISSIIIGLEVKASFGTVDHITVTSFPNTIYHVGETFSRTGLAVTAYDGADESTANFKDVTSDVTTLFGSNWPQRVGYTFIEGYAFVDGDVPGGNVEFRYTESGNNFSDYVAFSVYALAEYELVTETPSDWSGQYLLVSSYTDSSEVTHTVAINSALTNFDQPLNFKEVTETDGVITTGQELEWAIASYSSGYSMQGKNGKYGYGQSSNRFMTSDTAKQITFSLSGSTATITGATNYVLRLNSSTSGGERFGFYENGVANVSLYRLKVSDNADTYAQLFLSAFTCDSTGENAPEFTIKEGSTYWSWSLLATEYNTLTPVEKEQFRLGVPSKTGTNIEQALARYDLVVRKYGWDNFMSRVITSGAPMVQPVTNSSSSTIVIVVVALTSITSIGVLLVIKRKRSLVK